MGEMADEYQEVEEQMEEAYELHKEGKSHDEYRCPICSGRADE